MIKVEYLDHFGDDLAVVNAARVSFAKESELEFKLDRWDEKNDIVEWMENGWEEHSESTSGTIYSRLSDKDSKLIKYLATHQHTSPFNHAFFKFRVKAPIFVARQLVKHEYLPWNEVSRRYVNDRLEFYYPELDDWRCSVDSVKQGSGNPLEKSVAETLEMHYAHLVNDAARLYDFAMSNGLCAEQARMFLPQSLMTEWIWSGSFYAFIRMCQLRLDPHSQKESQVVAREILEHLHTQMPVSVESFFPNVS